MKASEVYPIFRNKIISECVDFPTVESIECDYLPVTGEKAKEAENEGGWFKVVEFNEIGAEHLTLLTLPAVFVLINARTYPKFGIL